MTWPPIKEHGEAQSLLTTILAADKSMEKLPDSQALLRCLVGDFLDNEVDSQTRS